MALEDYVPRRLRRRYSTKIAITLLLVVVVTVALGVVFATHATADMDAEANENLNEQTASSAATVEQWATANADLAAGFALMGDGRERVIRQTLQKYPSRIVEVHYVEGGDVTTFGAAGDQAPAFSEAGQVEPSPASGPLTRMTARHMATDGQTKVVSFIAADPAPNANGRIVLSVSLEYLHSQLSSAENTRTVLVTGDDTVLTGAGTVTDPEGEDVTSDEEILGTMDGTEDVQTTLLEGTGEFAVASSSVGSSSLGVVTYSTTAEVYSAKNSTVAGLIALLVVFVVHLGVVGIVLGGNVSLGLRQLASKAKSIGSGEFDVELETNRVDEVGTLYDAFRNMRDSLETTLSDLEEERERVTEAKEETERRNEQLIAEAERFREVMEACADGDLRQRLDPEIDDQAMIEIAESFNEMIAELEVTVAQVMEFTAHVDTASSEVETSAEEIAQASQEVSGSIQEISDGSHKQTKDLEVAAGEVKNLSATVEEVASTTGTIAEETERVANLAQSGKENAEATVEEMEKARDRTGSAVETMDKLTREVAEIEEVISLIDEIAQQTNMLALNAAIESARTRGEGSVGEEGFDVVADEVQELSEQTQDAVEEIEDTLQSIKERAESGATAVGGTDERITNAANRVNDLERALDEIVGGIESVNASIQEIDRATDDQAQSANEIATIMEDVASVSAETTNKAERVAAASEETTATIDEVSTEADRLDQRAGRLSQAVSEFSVSEHNPGTSGEGQTSGGRAR